MVNETITKFSTGEQSLNVNSPSVKIDVACSTARSIVFEMISASHLETVVDLFSGRGMFGLHAHLNGAGEVLWAERCPKVAKQIKTNRKKLKISKTKLKIKNKNCYKKVLKSVTKKPTLIYLNPELQIGHHYNEVLDYILDNDLLADGGIIVLEKPHREWIDSIDRFSTMEKWVIENKDLVFLSK